MADLRADRILLSLLPEPEEADVAAFIEVSKVLLAGSATAFGFAIGGPGGAGLGAALAQGGSSAIDAIGARWREKAANDAGRAFTAGAERSGLSYADLSLRLQSDPEKLALAVAALTVASETAVDEKVRLMGQVIANAATDEAVVDEELLMTRAVRALEAPHIRVLTLLADPPLDDSGLGQVRWSPAHLGTKVGWSTSSVTAVLMTLQSASCAILSPTRIDGGAATYADLMNIGRPVALQDMACEITVFGSDLLARLRACDHL